MPIMDLYNKEDNTVVLFKETSEFRDGWQTIKKATLVSIPDGAVHEYEFVETDGGVLCTDCAIDESGLNKVLFPCSDCQAFVDSGRSYHRERHHCPS